MRLLSILAVLVVLGLTMSQPASATCAGHETTASTPMPETVAEMPAPQTADPTSDGSTKKTTTTTQPGG
jgi:hypothetical protein